MRLLSKKMNKIAVHTSPQSRELCLKMRQMDLHPSGYYYGRFRSQFGEWVKKTKAHKHADGIYIFFRCLNEEKLSHVPRQDLALFHCALACTILIDQTMYSHFKMDYPKFQKMTQYPKMEIGGTGYHLHPWYIIGDVDRKEFREFVDFFIKDLKEFFTQTKFEFATWDSVRSAMLADEDIVGKYPGHVIQEILENN